VRSAIVALVLACSPAAEVAAARGHDANADVAEGAAVCEQCSTELSGDPPKDNWVCVKSLQVDLTEADGAPAVGVTAMSCSRGLCMARDSDAHGRVLVEPCSFVLDPTFRIVGFDRYVPFAIPLRGPLGTFAFHSVPLTRLPASGVPIGPTMSMAGVVVEATKIEVDEFAPYTDFRAVAVDKIIPGFDQGLALTRIYALGPQNTKLEGGRVSLPNRDRWAEGAAVEIWAHNVDLPAAAPAAMGYWWKASDGKVEGDRIVGEIPMLTVIAVRPKR
jgi:hypothetical protein